MTFVRPARRVLIAAASMSALFVAAACGGGGGAPSGGGSSAAGADFSKQGDIEVWHGKDSQRELPEADRQVQRRNTRTARSPSTSCPTPRTSSGSR